MTFIAGIFIRYIVKDGIFFLTVRAIKKTAACHATVFKAGFLLM